MAKKANEKSIEWIDFEKEIGKHMKGKLIQYNGPGIGFPIVLILIGIYIIGMENRWFPEVSVWAVILIGFGIMLLAGRTRCSNIK